MEVNNFYFNIYQSFRYSMHTHSTLKYSSRVKCSLDPRLQGICLNFMWTPGTYLTPSTQGTFMKSLLNWIRHQHQQSDWQCDFRADWDRHEKEKRLQIALKRCKDGVPSSWKHSGGRLREKTKKITKRHFLNVFSFYLHLPIPFTVYIIVTIILPKYKIPILLSCLRTYNEIMNEKKKEWIK